MARLILVPLTAISLLFASEPFAMALSSASNAARAHELLISRQDTSVCGGFNNITTCGLGLPSSFCCDSSTTCMPFNNGASAICCPAGHKCDVIVPIACVAQSLNATLFPFNPLHTSDFTDALPSCGSGCCPVGYDCRGGDCIIDPRNATAPQTSATSTTASATAGASSLSTATSPTSSASSAPLVGQSSSSDCASCPQFPASAVMVGLFPGIIFGILLAVGFILCFGRSKPPQSPSSSLGPTMAKVSDPIYQANGAGRTDFLRHQPHPSPRSPGSTIVTGTSTQRSSRVRSLFSKTPSIRGKAWGRPPTNDLVRTPEAQIRREPSMESIKVYSSPEENQRITQFGDFLDQSRRQDENVYMGSPGRVDPRSRGLGGL